MGKKKKSAGGGTGAPAGGSATTAQPTSNRTSAAADGTASAPTASTPASSPLSSSSLGAASSAASVPSATTQHQPKTNHTPHTHNTHAQHTCEHHAHQPTRHSPAAHGVDPLQEVDAALEALDSQAAARFREDEHHHHQGESTHGDGEDGEDDEEDHEDGSAADDDGLSHGEEDDDDEEEEGDLLEEDADSKQGFVEALIRLLEDSAHTHAHAGHTAAAAAAADGEERKDDGALQEDAAGGSAAAAGGPPSTSAPFFSQSSLDAAFLLSCEGGHIRILYLLLPRISSLGVTNERGETGLHLAARSGHRDIVELLTTQQGRRGGCEELEMPAHDGTTPLYAAIAANQLHVAAFLLEGIRPRARVDGVDATGESMLHLACRSGYSQLVLLLLRAGADAQQVNDKDEAPLDVAKNVEIARVLLEFQAQRQATAAAHAQHTRSSAGQARRSPYGTRAAMASAGGARPRQRQQQPRPLLTQTLHPQPITPEEEEALQRAQEEQERAQAEAEGYEDDEEEEADEDDEEDADEEEEDFVIPDEPESDEEELARVEAARVQAMQQKSAAAAAATAAAAAATATAPAAPSASSADSASTASTSASSKPTPLPDQPTSLNTATSKAAAATVVPSSSSSPPASSAASAVATSTPSAPSSHPSDSTTAAIEPTAAGPEEEAHPPHLHHPEDDLSASHSFDDDDEEEAGAHSSDPHPRHHHEEDEPEDDDDDSLSIASSDSALAPLDFQDLDRLGLPPYSAVVSSPFRQLPPGPASNLFWTALGVGADAAMFSQLGVYPFDRLVDTERILVLAQVAEAMTGLAPAGTELAPTILNESALYAVFALMKLRIGQEICPDPTSTTPAATASTVAVPPTPALPTIDSDPEDADGEAAGVDGAPGGSVPSPPPKDPPTSTVWRQRVLEAYEQVYSTSSAAAGLRVSCTRLTVWSAVINLLARSLFGASFTEKKKLFTNPNGWERKLRQIAAAKSAAAMEQQQAEQQEKMRQQQQAQAHAAAAPGSSSSALTLSAPATPATASSFPSQSSLPPPASSSSSSDSLLLSLPPHYFSVLLPSTHALEIQLTFKKLLLMSKTFLDPNGATAAGAKAGCFCRECISELEVPMAFKMQFMDSLTQANGAGGDADVHSSAHGNSSTTTNGGSSRKSILGGKGKKGKHGSSSKANHTQQQQQQQQAPQPHPHGKPFTAVGPSAAEKQHFQKLDAAPGMTANGKVLGAGVQPSQPSAAVGAVGAPSPPPYTLDSLILTSGPELQNYWCGLSMEDKWALTELPLTYLHQLISRHLNWELLRAALESYEEYAWEEDILEIHEGQTITVADEMCEEGSMEDLLQAMIHAIHMRQLEERGEMDAQFEHALMRGDGAQPLQLNLSASTQSARQMLENLVLSEFARKIAAAFLVSKRESRAQQMAYELEQELLAEERERARLEAGGTGAVGKKKKKLKAKLKKKAKLQQANSAGGADDADEDDTPSAAEAAAAREQFRLAQEELARQEKLAAELAAKEAEEQRKREEEEAERERERKRAEVREAKAKAKRERKQAKREERMAAAAAAGVAHVSENDEEEGVSPMRTMTPETQAAATAAPAAPATPLSSAAALALAAASATAPDGTPLNKKARRALLKAAKEALELEEREKEQQRRRDLGLPPLEEEEAAQAAAEAAAEEARLQAEAEAQQAEADAQAAAEAAATAAAIAAAQQHKPEEEEKTASPARASGRAGGAALAANSNRKKSSSEKHPEETKEQSPSSSSSVRSGAPQSFDDFDCGVMLICSRDQIKDGVGTSSSAGGSLSASGGAGRGGSASGHPPHHQISLKILGLPRKHAAILNQLTPAQNHHSTALFLFNVTDRLLHGVYYLTDADATSTHNTNGGAPHPGSKHKKSSPGFLVVPSLTPAPGTLPFPPSLRVARFEPTVSASTSTGQHGSLGGAGAQEGATDPIPEAAFRHLFADGNRIRLLELRQVKELMAIFRARARNHRAPINGDAHFDHDEQHLYGSSASLSGGSGIGGGGGGVTSHLRTLTGITPIPLAISQPTSADSSTMPGGEKLRRTGGGANSSSQMNGSAPSASGATSSAGGGLMRGEKRERGERGARTRGVVAPGYKSGISVLTPIVPSPMPVHAPSTIEEAISGKANTSAGGVDKSSPWKSVDPSPSPLMEIIAATPHSHVLTADYAPLGSSVTTSSMAASPPLGASLIPRANGLTQNSSGGSSALGSSFLSSLAPSSLDQRFSSDVSLRHLLGSSGMIGGGGDSDPVVGLRGVTGVSDSDLLPDDTGLMAAMDAGLNDVDDDDSVEFGLDSERMLQDLEQWDQSMDQLLPTPSGASALSSKNPVASSASLSTSQLNRFDLGSVLGPSSGSVNGGGLTNTSRSERTTSLFSFASGVKQQLIDDDDDSVVLMPAGGVGSRSLGGIGSGLGGGLGGALGSVNSTSGPGLLRLFDSTPLNDPRADVNGVGGGGVGGPGGPGMGGESMYGVHLNSQMAMHAQQQPQSQHTQQQQQQQLRQSHPMNSQQQQQQQHMSQALPSHSSFPLDVVLERSRLENHYVPVSAPSFSGTTFAPPHIQQQQHQPPQGMFQQQHDQQHARAGNDFLGMPSHQQQQQLSMHQQQQQPPPPSMPPSDFYSPSVVLQQSSRDDIVQALWQPNPPPANNFVPTQQQQQQAPLHMSHGGFGGGGGVGGNGGVAQQQQHSNGGAMSGPFNGAGSMWQSAPQQQQQQSHAQQQREQELAAHMQSLSQPAMFQSPEQQQMQAWQQQQREQQHREMHLQQMQQLQHREMQLQQQALQQSQLGAFAGPRW